jgi:hypothetical protein
MSESVGIMNRPTEALSTTKGRRTDGGSRRRTVGFE